MGPKWMIDVLADLRTFADQNGLPLLVRQLDITSTVAQSEIASVMDGTPHASDVDTGQSVPSSGANGSSQ